MKKSTHTHILQRNKTTEEENVLMKIDWKEIIVIPKNDMN